MLPLTCRWRWFPTPRLHRSTYVVGALIGAVLLLANIPGRIVRPIESGDLTDDFRDERFYVDHGWPLAFLRRNIDQHTVSVVYDYQLAACLSRVKPAVFWTIGRDVKAFGIAGCAADLATAAVLVAAGAAAFETWRRRRRRLFQFYLVELLAFVTLVAVLLSWLAVETRERREEQQAVRRIRPIVYAQSLTGPHWLRQMVGSPPFEVFDRVDRICIQTWYSDSATVHDMAELRPFENPEQLMHLRHLRVIDCGSEPPELVLGFVPRPDRLEDFTCVPSEKVLSCLRQAPNLRKLKVLSHFSSNPPRLYDVATLASLTKLRYLYFSGVEVDDECLSYLENLPRLEVLSVSSGAITDTGLSHLSGLRCVRELDLTGADLTDGGLQHVGTLESLRYLSIACTKVSDAGLERLHELKRLRHLNVSFTETTPEGIRRLNEALPECVVDHMVIKIPHRKGHH